MYIINRAVYSHPVYPNIIAQHTALHTKSRQTRNVATNSLKRKKESSVDKTVDDGLYEIALNLTKQYGWNVAVMHAASSSLSLALVSNKSDVYKMTGYLLQKLTQRLKADATSVVEELHKSPFEEKLLKLLIVFINYFKEYQPYWYQAHQIRVEYEGATASITFGYQLAGEICRLCSDTEDEDMWASHRCCLAILYAAAENHLMHDVSSDLKQTKEYILSNADVFTKASGYGSMVYATAWSLASIVPSFLKRNLRN